MKIQTNRLHLTNARTHNQLVLILKFYLLFNRNVTRLKRLKIVRALSKNEQTLLLSACQKKEIWDKMYLFVLMALTTGARRSELLNLKWSDLDFCKCIAKLESGITKGKINRYIKLTQPVMCELMKHQKNTEGLIFHSKKSKDSAFDIKRQWKIVLINSGISNCRFHDLRHTFACNLIMSGKTAHETADFLGHFNTEMIRSYVFTSTL